MVAHPEWMAVHFEHDKKRPPRLASGGHRSARPGRAGRRRNRAARAEIGHGRPCDDSRYMLRAAMRARETPKKTGTATARSRSIGALLEGSRSRQGADASSRLRPRGLTGARHSDAMARFGGIILSLASRYKAPKNGHALRGQVSSPRRREPSSGGSVGWRDCGVAENEVTPTEARSGEVASLRTSTERSDP